MNTKPSPEEKQARKLLRWIGSSRKTLKQTPARLDYWRTRNRELLASGDWLTRTVSPCEEMVSLLMLADMCGENIAHYVGRLSRIGGEL